MSSRKNENPDAVPPKAKTFSEDWTPVSAGKTTYFVAHYKL